MTVLVTILSCSRGPKWKLVWADEFDEPGPPDSSRWAIVEKGPKWRNNEDQAYMNRPENIRCEDGFLIIEARNDGYGGYGYTSARLDTGLAGEWTYGRIEVRAKLPAGTGTWPAIFMLASQNIMGARGWPTSGEIDIMEHVGFNPGYVRGSVHCGKYNHSIGTSLYEEVYLPDYSEEFHIYGVEWYPDRLDFFIDDQYYFTFENEMTDFNAWPFYKDFYLILCLAVGGDWGGMNGIDDDIFPVQMVVDYVRVYQTDLRKLGYEDPESYRLE
jgi:beta-glucanase (GH16 family)